MRVVGLEHVDVVPASLRVRDVEERVRDAATVREHHARGRRVQREVSRHHVEPAALAEAVEGRQRHVVRELDERGVAGEMSGRRPFPEVVVGAEAVELQLVSGRIPSRADPRRDDVRVVRVHPPVPGEVLRVEELHRPVLLPGVVGVVGIDHRIVIRERPVEERASPRIADDVVVVAALIVPIAAPEECRADRAGARQSMFPGRGELVDVRPSVEDAAVLRVAERHAEREPAGQGLVERRVVSRRGPENVGRQDVGGMRGPVAAAQIQPLIAALRRAAKHTVPAGIERDAEVGHPRVLMEFAIGGVGRQRGRQQRAEHFLSIGREDARALGAHARLHRDPGRWLPSVLEVRAVMVLVGVVADRRAAVEPAQDVALEQHVRAPRRARWTVVELSRCQVAARLVLDVRIQIGAAAEFV